MFRDSSSVAWISAVFVLWHTAIGSLTAGATRLTADKDDDDGVTRLTAGVTRLTVSCASTRAGSSLGSTQPSTASSVSGLDPDDALVKHMAQLFLDPALAKNVVRRPNVADILAGEATEAQQMCDYLAHHITQPVRVRTGTRSEPGPVQYICTRTIISDIPEPKSAVRAAALGFSRVTAEGNFSPKPIRTTWQTIVDGLPVSCSSRRPVVLDRRERDESVKAWFVGPMTDSPLVEIGHDFCWDCELGGVLGEAVVKTVSRQYQGLGSTDEEYKKIFSEETDLGGDRSRRSRRGPRWVDWETHLSKAFPELWFPLLKEGCNSQNNNWPEFFLGDRSAIFNIETLFQNRARGSFPRSSLLPGVTPRLSATPPHTAPDIKQLLKVVEPLPPRTYIFSDIHGDYEKFRALLLDMGLAMLPTETRMGGIKRGEIPITDWSREITWTDYALSLPAGSHLIILGDVIDRGYYPFSIYTAIVELWRQKHQTGRGGIKLTLFQGNHDFERMFGSLRLRGITDEDLSVWQSYWKWIGGLEEAERKPLQDAIDMGEQWRKIPWTHHSGNESIYPMTDSTNAQARREVFEKAFSFGLFAWLYLNAAIIGIVGGSLLVHAGIPYEVLRLAQTGTFAQTPEGTTWSFLEPLKGTAEVFITMFDILPPTTHALHFLGYTAGQPGYHLAGAKLWADDYRNKFAANLPDESLAAVVDINNLVWVRLFWQVDHDVIAICDEIDLFLRALNHERHGFRPISRIITGHTPLIPDKGHTPLIPIFKAHGTIMSRCPVGDRGDLVLQHQNLLWNIDVGHSKHYSAGFESIVLPGASRDQYLTISGSRRGEEQGVTVENVEVTGVSRADPYSPIGNEGVVAWETHWHWVAGRRSPFVPSSIAP